MSIPLGEPLDIQFSGPVRDRPEVDPVCVVGLGVGAAVEDGRFRGMTLRRASVRRAIADVALVHLRVERGHELGGLPGLVGGDHPSRVRDAVALALLAGAPEVEVVLGWRRPWRRSFVLARRLRRRRSACGPLPGRRPVRRAVAPPPLVAAMRSLLEDAEAFLAERPCALVLVPDLPRPTGGSDPAWTAIAEALRRLTREHRQVVLLDAPGPEAGDAVRAVTLRGGADVAICAWRGSDLALARHGWRSAAAVVAGILAARGPRTTSGLVGARVRLDAGRVGPEDRAADLLPWRRPADGAPLPVVYVELSPAGEAVVRGDATLRAPTWSWTLPAVRTVKRVHHHLLVAAQTFVFRGVTETDAAALATLLDRALRPFAAEGVLVERRDGGPPRVVATPVREPAAPGLEASLSAVLLPWTEQVRLRVSLRPGQAPTVEVE